MKVAAATLAVVLGIAFSNMARAEGYHILPVYGSHYGSGYARAPYYGYGYGGGTVFGSYLRGKAAVIDAWGRYNRNTAAAAIDAEKARSLAYDNHLKKIDTYYAAREKSREYRAAERGPRLTQEQLIRISKEAAPDRLRQYELDPVFGGIQWPDALKNDRFADLRAEIETLYRSRDAENGETLAVRIEARVNDLLAGLQTMIGAIPTGEYIQAKNFARSLAYEARFPTDTNRVAYERTVTP